MNTPCTGRDFVYDEAAGFRFALFQTARSIPTSTIHSFLDENCFSLITVNDILDECKGDEEEG